MSLEMANESSNNLAEMKKNQKKLTDRLLNSKHDFEKNKTLNKKYEENFEFKPKITKDKYYLAAKEKEIVELENLSLFK
jgi:hypothetical protein